MLSKTQKTVMYIISIAAVILGVITAIPFRTLTFFDAKTVLNAELVLKFIVFPILALCMVIYFNVLKYKSISEGGERLKSVNVMSYLPVIVYVIGILVLTIHTLTFNDDSQVMQSVPHMVLLAVFAVYLLCVFFVAFSVNDFTMSMTKKGNIILDVLFGVILVIFTVICWRILASYKEKLSFLNEYIWKYGHSQPDVFLFVEYVVLVVGVVYYLIKVITMIKAEETVIYVVNPSEGELDQQFIDNYDDAYNDILDEFEDYFDVASAEFVEEENLEEKQPEASEEK